MIFVAPIDSNPIDCQLIVVLDEPSGSSQAQHVKVLADDCAEADVAKCVTDWLSG